VESVLVGHLGSTGVVVIVLVNVYKIREMFDELRESISLDHEC
jgi:hypothetical protein